MREYVANAANMGGGKNNEEFWDADGIRADRIGVWVGGK